MPSRCTLAAKTDAGKQRPEKLDYAFLDQETRKLIALRGHTIRLEWHPGWCDDCDFVFDADGKMICPLDSYGPHFVSTVYAIEDKKLTVTHTKKSVKIENRQDDNPVVGKGKGIVYAYLDWLIQIEKQKQENNSALRTEPTADVNQSG